VLKLDWQWVNIIKPPKIHTIPDILTPVEIEQLIGATRKLRYRVFLLTTYSMGLRLQEALSLKTIQKATTHMDRGGTQKAMKMVVTECGIKKKSRYTPCATVSPRICLNAV
jgi:site-specific recombinase XerD